MTYISEEAKALAVDIKCCGLQPTIEELSCYIQQAFDAHDKRLMQETLEKARRQLITLASKANHKEDSETFKRENKK